MIDSEVQDNQYCLPNNRISKSKTCILKQISFFSWFDIRLELAGAIVVWLATIFSIIGRDHLSGAAVGFMLLHALEVKYNC